MKKAKIIQCVFTSEWKNPSNTMTYFHDLTFENGDKGACGVMEKYHRKISVGALVEYTIDERMKIKILSSNMDVSTTTQASNTNYPSNNNNAAARSQSPAPRGGGYAKKQDEFLGFTWGYAKDLIIGGKTMKDVEELNKVARYIYNQIGDMLANPHTPNIEIPIQEAPKAAEEVTATTKEVSKPVANTVPKKQEKPKPVIPIVKKATKPEKLSIEKAQEQKEKQDAIAKKLSELNNPQRTLPLD